MCTPVCTCAGNTGSDLCTCALEDTDRNVQSSHGHDGRKLNTVQASSNSGIYQQSVTHSCSNRRHTGDRKEVQPRAACPPAPGPIISGLPPSCGLSRVCPASWWGSGTQGTSLFCQQVPRAFWQRPWLDAAGRKGLSSGSGAFVLPSATVSQQMSPRG